MTEPAGDQISDHWRRQVGAAKITWKRLTANELLTSDGDRHRLIALVRDRYGVTLGEAERQVRNFFQRHRVLK